MLRSKQYLQLFQSEAPAISLFQVILDCLPVHNWPQGTGDWSREHFPGLLSPSCKKRASQTTVDVSQRAKFCLLLSLLTILSAGLACRLIKPGLDVELPLFLEVLVGNHVVVRHHGVGFRACTPRTAQHCQKCWTSQSDDLLLTSLPPYEAAAKRPSLHNSLQIGSTFLLFLDGKFVIKILFKLNSLNVSRCKR